MSDSLSEFLTFEMAVNVARDLCYAEVNKQVMTLLARMLAQFSSNKQISLLRGASARALNTYLIRTAKEQINLFVKINLRSLIQDHLMAENKQIFEGVPADTIDHLKNFYD